MKKTIIDLFEDSVVKYGAKTFLLEKKHRALNPRPTPDQGAGARDRRGAGRGGHTSRGQSGLILSGGVQCMDHFGTGRLLCRGGQRAAVGETRRVERPAVPYAPCRKSGRCSYRNTSSPRSGAYARSCRRWSISSSSATCRSKRARRRSERPAHGTRLPGGKQGGVLAIGRSIRNDDYATITYVGHHGRPERRR